MPAYSDPLDEQDGAVTLMNFLQQQPDWKNTAVLITWDDSDGWYDHVFTKVTSPSFDAEADQLDGPGKCGAGAALPGVGGKPVNGRCGPGTRIPFHGDFAMGEANLSIIARFRSVPWCASSRTIGCTAQRIGDGSFDAESRIDQWSVRLHGRRQQCRAVSRSGDRHAGLHAPPAAGGAH